jgi:hypothetical protein
MATIMPKSELVKRALEWVTEQRKDGVSPRKLIDEAAMRYNLSPMDVQFLEKLVKTSPE